MELRDLHGCDTSYFPIHTKSLQLLLTIACNCVDFCPFMDDCKNFVERCGKKPQPTRALGNPWGFRHCNQIVHKFRTQI